MATLLLVVIYISFIGLGIPDSLFGTAWPAIYKEFNMPIAAASYVTLLMSICTIISSLMSAWIINKYKTSWVTAVSTAMTAAGLLGFSQSGSMLWLCLFAIPLGFGAGAIDSGLNNYVALHYKATHMNFLHCFYGLGVTLSPYLMSIALGDDANWRKGYRIAFFIQLGITIITFISLPLWKKTHPYSKHSREEKPKTLSLLSMARMPAVRAVWILFIGSCALEVTCGVWCSSFLVNSKAYALDAAARVVTLYYGGMAIGRLLSGIMAARISSWNIIHICQGILFAAIVLVMLPLPASFTVAGLFLIGLGNGPVFPNLTHLTPINFGRDVSQSVIGSQLAASSIGIMVLPPVFGLLAQAFSTDLFPYYLLVLFIVVIFYKLKLIKLLKAQRKYTAR